MVPFAAVVTRINIILEAMAPTKSLSFCRSALDIHVVGAEFA